MSRLFGTDGVRGIANQSLTCDLAYKLGYAGAMVLASGKVHKPKIMVGCDTRVSCPMLESALTAGICSAGVDVHICGVIPTPAVAYLTRKYKFDAGVMISASHNSYEYNGIKFFSGTGFKLPDSVEDKIEQLIMNYHENERYCPIGDKIGNRTDFLDAPHLYAEHLKRRMSSDLSGMRVAVDCSNGAASAIAPQLFKDLGATVFVTGAEPNGVNINKECGSTHIEYLQQLVIEKKCHVGLAFDGDADRFLAVDDTGAYLDGDVIMSLIGLHMKKENTLKSDTIVTTVMSNLGMDIMAKKEGIQLEKTKVGDRYVLEKMIEGDFNLGGEQSGHVILLDHATTGDGILTALAFLRVYIRSKKKFSVAKKVITILPQVLVPAAVSDENKSSAMSSKAVLKKIAECEKKLGEKGRILVRASGTEPVIRVMVEGEDLSVIQDMADRIAEMIVSLYG